MRLFLRARAVIKFVLRAASTLQEYPSDPLRKISALQTKVELAGNLSNKQNLAENLAYRELASWEFFFWCSNSLHCGFTNQFWLEITFRMRSLTVCHLTL